VPVPVNVILDPEVYVISMTAVAVESLAEQEKLLELVNTEEPVSVTVNVPPARVPVSTTV